MVVCRIKEKIDIYIHENSWGELRSSERVFLNITFLGPWASPMRSGGKGVLTDLVSCTGLVLQLKAKRGSHVELKKEKIDIDIHEKSWGLTSKALSAERGFFMNIKLSSRRDGPPDASHRLRAGGRGPRARVVSV